MVNLINKHKIAVVVLFGLILSTLLISDARGNSRPTIKRSHPWQLVFQDEFDGDQLDKTKWVTCYDWFNEEYQGCSNDGNQEQQWYTAQQASLWNGNLLLMAVPEKTKGWNGQSQQEYLYKSGMVSTGRPNWNEAVKSEYTYGYFEARMRTASGKGIWPAFWLLPSDHSWPPEIDVMEILGDKPHEVLMTNHWGTADQPQKDSSIFADLNNPNDWHTFSINWQPGSLDWFVDGKLRKSVRSQDVPDKPMEIILNLAIGGKLPGNPDNMTPFPAKLEVDYVRVYQPPTADTD